MLHTGKKVSLLLLLLTALSGSVLAQNNTTSSEEGGGAYPTHINDAAHPCITPQQYADIEKQIAHNIKLLGLDNQHQNKTTTTTFSWPVQSATSLTDCSYYVIFNYVDQDTTSPGIKDYNCGTATYDGHRGTDIAAEPYPFYKMDNNQLNVVAAAPGTIIQKSDGFFDRNCAMNSDTANYIIIQHADGSCALYWHMKKFSLTSKTVGMSVATGEFLGVMGSSGSSTSPHLHFEVWGNTLSSSLKDPYSGSCNIFNPATWWISQKPYTEPAVIKAQVNLLPVVLPGCDTTETPNEDTCFSPGVTAKFYIFLRNETPGDTVHESILNPGGSTFSSWTHNSITAHQASYWFFNRVLPSTAGVYTFHTTYNGITCDKTFKISCGALSTNTISANTQIEVYPNPATNELNISSTDKITDVVISTLLGQTIYNYKYSAEKVEINIKDLPKGIYMVRINGSAVRKFVKE